jgi:hypothetical protein
MRAPPQLAVPTGPGGVFSHDSVASSHAGVPQTRTNADSYSRVRVKSGAEGVAATGRPSEPARFVLKCDAASSPHRHHIRVERRAANSRYFGTSPSRTQRSTIMRACRDMPSLPGSRGRLASRSLPAVTRFDARAQMALRYRPEMCARSLSCGGGPCRGSAGWDQGTRNGA